MFIGTEDAAVLFSMEPEASRKEVLKSLPEELIAHLMQEFDIKMDDSIHFNDFPISITEITPMEHIYILFEMVKVSCIFVVLDIELKGMITRNSLLKKLKSADPAVASLQK